MKPILCLFLLAVLYSSAPGAQNLSSREIPTREGVKMKFAYQSATEPIASAVLLQGGAGTIGVSGSATSGWVKWDGQFLSGGSGRFAAAGVSAAAVDVPSDKFNLNSGFRGTPEHAQDLAAMMAFLRREAPGKPVCLVGTSNGSLSAVAAAGWLGEQGPDCIVLTSSVSVKPSSSLIARFAHPFTDADLTRVKVPVLIVHHKKDLCKYSPFEPMPSYVAAFTSSPRVDFLAIEGGEDHSDSCNRGHHQFLGIEQDVTNRIAAWIKATVR